MRGRRQIVHVPVGSTEGGAVWREDGRVAIKHEKRREERGMEEVEEEVVEVRKRREEEAESRREQGEQTVEWKEVVVSRDSL